MEPTFIHLSDIHFKLNANTTYDAYKDLRNELERDAVEIGKKLGGIHGILVSGDIAFSGQENEYKIAHEWLQQMSGKVNCPRENVLVIPGNHDVDRKMIEKSMFLKDAHRNLRHKDVAQLDEKLAGYFAGDPDEAKLMYKPIQNYTDFAAKYGCDISPKVPFWEDDWTLNDGSTLRIRGINSTIVSDELDSDLSYKLVVGKRQLEMTTQDGVEYLALCHHPPSWLLDQDPVEDLLGNRARVQLFGHKHRQRLQQIGQSVRLTAGAMHPDEREPNWEPRYNLLQISVEQDTEQKRFLKVTVYPRVYSEERSKFMADYNDKGAEYTDFRFLLPDWKPRALSEVKATATAHEIERPAESLARGSKMRAGRRLTYRFMDLPHHVKLKIAQKLDLIRDEDEGLRDAELYKRYFERATEMRKLAELWRAVQKEYGESEEGNPYESNSGAA